MSDSTAHGKITVSWREALPVHPAAEHLPLMSADRLRELGEDIIKNGLTNSVVLWRADPKSPLYLVDGRNRCDALELVTGSPVEVGAPSLMAGDFLARDKVVVLDGLKVDPWDYVASANVHRRHLNAGDRQKALVGLIARTPEKSDRQIAKEIGVDHKTIAGARAKGEATGEVSPVEKRVGGDGRARRQPAREPRNLTRAMHHRRMKLGDEVVDSIKGTSLDSAAELDQLIVLNRGVALGELTPIVKRLVDDAVAGENVSAVHESNKLNVTGRIKHLPTLLEFWRKNAIAVWQRANADEREQFVLWLTDQINEGRWAREHDQMRGGGAHLLRREDISSDARKLTRMEELEDANQQLAIRMHGYESQIEELKGRSIDRLSAAQILDALEARLERAGINASTQLQKIRDRLEQSRPEIELEALPVEGNA